MIVDLLWLVLVVVVLAVAVTTVRRRLRPPRSTAERAPVAELPPDPRPVPLTPSESSSVDAQIDLTEHEVLERLYAVALDRSVASGQRANPEDAAHAEVARDVTAVLSHMRKGAQYVPRRPQLLPQLLGMVNNDEASGRQIARIIAQDPALVASLLRIANSPLYRVQSQPVESIDTAVARIGTDGLRQMIAVALLQPVMSDGGQGTFGRLQAEIWEHTLLAAVAAVAAARCLGRFNAFEAQMLGLLHGLGATVVARTVRDAYARRPQLVPAAGTVSALLEQWSAPTAAWLARDWELPPGFAPMLESQRVDTPMQTLDLLARALRIGWVAGATAVLVRHGALADGDASALLQRMGLHPDAVAAVRCRLADAASEDRAG